MKHLSPCEIGAYILSGEKNITGFIDCRTFRENDSILNPSFNPELTEKMIGWQISVTIRNAFSHNLDKESEIPQAEK